jgi:hypothetical protein
MKDLPRCEAYKYAFIALQEARPRKYQRVANQRSSCHIMNAQRKVRVWVFGRKTKECDVDAAPVNDTAHVGRKQHPQHRGCFENEKKTLW